MKTRIISHRNSCYELIVDNGTKGSKRLVLASMTLFEGTGAWMLTDIRLNPHRSPDEYSGGLYSDDISSRLKPVDAAEAAQVKAYLHTYTEDENGLRWSTYAGLVRGAPRDDTWLQRDNHIGYFTRDEGLAHLRGLQPWWEGYEGPLEDAKIPNPWLQPSCWEIRSEIRYAQLVKDSGAPDCPLLQLNPKRPEEST